MEEKLVCFLYLLTRDHLPSGVVVKLVEDAKTIRPSNEAVYTSKALEAFARELVDRWKAADGVPVEIQDRPSRPKSGSFPHED